MDISLKKTFLEQYFIHICQFSHNKAKELIEKENEENTKAPLLWTSFLNLLGTLATSEKNIYSLNFLQEFNSRKLFWRKDTLINTLGTLLSELKKMQAVFSEAGSEEGSLETFVMKLAGQLHYLIQLRINIMNFYKQLFSQNNGYNMNIADNLNNIEAGLIELDDIAFHSLLTPFKCLMLIEYECSIYLLKTNLSIQQCNYLDSLLNLLTASSKLNSWLSMRLSNENRKLALLSSKYVSLELLDWMTKYKLLLVSKFSFYFYHTLSAQSNNNEVKTLMANNPFDFYARIITMQKKLDAQFIAFLFNSPNANIKLDLSYQMQQPKSSSTKINCFFYYPSDKHDKYMDIILLNFQEKNSELRASEKIIISTDETLQSSIILHCIDEYTTMALVVNKKTKIDTFNSSMITIFSADLKCNKLCLLFKSK